ncbi:MAG: DUF4878 domain-containing protein [Ignavibacteria bacterium]
MKKQIYILFVLILLAGCGSTGGSDSPANSIKDFDKVLQEQNPGKALELSFSGSQKMYDDIAKTRNQSGKEYFEKSFSSSGTVGMMGSEFEVVEEKKEGDKATVIIKLKDNSNSELYSIKEDGTWKLDYARYMEENMKKVE